MADAENPWTELVSAARVQIQRANAGNTLAAKDVLRQAAVGLRDILRGGTADPERLEYLSYLLIALEQIDQDVPPDKALGLWSGNRPKFIPDERDPLLFLAVGLAVDQAKNRSAPKPIDDAISTVAKRFGCDESTVKKAWEKCGATPAWEQAHEPDASKGK